MVGIIREIVRFQARREGKYNSPTPPACLGKLIPVGRKEDHPSVQLMSGNPNLSGVGQVIWRELDMNCGSRPEGKLSLIDRIIADIGQTLGEDF